MKAALAPPSIWLNTSIRRYALRALKLPSSHLINKIVLAINSKSPDFDFNKKIDFF